MGPLAPVGEETGVSIWLTRHPNKQVGAAAMYRGGGSLGIIGAALFGLALGRDPQDIDRIVMAPIKCNIGPMPPSLAFRLEGMPGSDHAKVKWDREPCYLTADDILLAPPNQSAKANTETELWLLTKLGPGPRLVGELEAEAEAEHHGWRTANRAKKTLQVRSERVGFSKGSLVYWLPPGQELPPAPSEDQTEDETGLRPYNATALRPRNRAIYGTLCGFAHTTPHRAIRCQLIASYGEQRNEICANLLRMPYKYGCHGCG